MHDFKIGECLMCPRGRRGHITGTRDGFVLATCENGVDWRFSAAEAETRIHEAAEQRAAVDAQHAALVAKGEAVAARKPLAAERDEAIDALRKLSSDWCGVVYPDPEPVAPAAPVIPPRTHNATCPRCYGPAYQGLGLPRCERVGGCLAEREPRVARENMSRRGSDVYEARLSNRETAWFFKGSSDAYATRDLAVTAWREAMLARTKREAGL